jgi:sterol desaturase/sphingolipid hydroxylase (fatty acid hydroxylase superfamily)
MEVQVNWLAVLLAMVSSMVVGSVWYAESVFGRAWMKLTKADPSKGKKSDVWKPIVVTMVVSLITAYVLAHVTYLANNFFGNSFLHDALTTAFWVWLGFTATRLVTHDVFEGRPYKLTAINAAHELVTFLVMGLVIGLLKP